MNEQFYLILYWDLNSLKILIAVVLHSFLNNFFLLHLYVKQTKVFLPALSQFKKRPRIVPWSWPRPQKWWQRLGKNSDESNQLPPSTCPPEKPSPALPLQPCILPEMSLLWNLFCHFCLSIPDILHYFLPM